MYISSLLNLGLSFKTALLTKPSEQAKDTDQTENDSRYYTILLAKIDYSNMAIMLWYEMMHPTFVFRQTLVRIHSLKS